MREIIKAPCYTHHIFLLATTSTQQNLNLL